MIVADVNVVAYLLIEGLYTKAARNTLLRDGHWIAPPLWRFEFTNVLATHVRKKLFSLDQAMGKLDAADRLISQTSTAIDDREIISMASNSRIALYDCAFVWLAKQYSVKVITRDQAMLDQFPDVAINLEEFGS